MAIINNERDVKEVFCMEKIESFYDSDEIDKILFSQADSDGNSVISNVSIMDGNNLSKLEIITSTIISSEQCDGHFGNGTGNNLRIPLLYIVEKMLKTIEVVARLYFSNYIAIPVKALKIKAEIKELMSPPAIVKITAKNFSKKGNYLRASAVAYVDDRKYSFPAEIQYLLIPKNSFRRISKDIPKKINIPDLLLDGYRIIKELDRLGIEELLLERDPFLKMDKAILLKSNSCSSFRVITYSYINQDESLGNLFLDGSSTISPVLFAKRMALTGELLASFLSLNKFGFKSVPIAINVHEVNSSENIFIKPPSCIVSVADISEAGLRRSRKEIYIIDNTRTFTLEGEKILDMQKLIYFLIPEEKFLI